MMHAYGWNMGMAGWGWLFQLAILVLFFLVVWWMVKNQAPSHAGNSAEEILKKRLVKGEIDKEEYRKLKKEIE